MIRAAHKNIVNQDCLSIVYLLYPQLLSAYCQYCLSIAFLSMIDIQIRASLWRRSRTELNTSKNNIVDFYFLQQNHFPWRMRVFHCCRRLLLHNITRRTIGEQISIECFGFGRNDSFDIYVFNPFIKKINKKSLWWCIKYTTVCFSSTISPSRSNFLPQQIVFVANDLYFVGDLLSMGGTKCLIKSIPILSTYAQREPSSIVTLLAGWRHHRWRLKQGEVDTIGQR